MSNAMERIKNKIRNANGSSVHSQLIDTSANDGEGNANGNVIADINENVNVNVNANAFQADHATNAGKGPAKREKRKKFEELYKRDTFWIQNELKDRLDAYCKGERGEKTRVINEALKEYMEKL